MSSLLFVRAEQYNEALETERLRRPLSLDVIMIPSDSRQRLKEALANKNHAEAVICLAKSFRDEGMPQKEMYLLFSELQLRCDNDDPRKDSILDTMDLIIGGPWAKGRDLYAHALTNDEIERIHADNNAIQTDHPTDGR